MANRTTDDWPTQVIALRRGRRAMTSRWARMREKAVMISCDRLGCRRCEKLLSMICLGLSLSAETESVLAKGVPASERDMEILAVSEANSEARLALAEAAIAEEEVAMWEKEITATGEGGYHVA